VDITHYHKDTILDSINEGVFTVDLDWKITSFNRAAEQITQVKRKDAIGRFCYNIFRAVICENECALKQTISTGKPTVNVTTRIFTRSGNQVPIRISTAPLEDSNGTIIGGVETFQDLSRVDQLLKELESRYTFEDIIGQSPVMMDLFQILPQIAESDCTVLIEGDSGTGKELFARAIHNLSCRRKKRFVGVNCAALPDTLLESELFGYKAGAFTGAVKDKPGRFVTAEGGTILLDEIADISPALQVKLLRVLQEKRIELLGSVKPVKVNVRVIASTNKNIKVMLRRGRFRKDLFYRINVVRLKLPTLQQRSMDVPILVDHLVAKFNRIRNKDIVGVSANALKRLMEYDYPGNVRELENIIEHAFVLCSGGLIRIRHLPPEIRSASEELRDQSTDIRTLKVMERLMIIQSLHRHDGNRKCAAKELGIDYSTLYRKIKSLRIQTPPTDGRSRKG
jgi:PAS domain S-box-containing protein